MAKRKRDVPVLFWVSAEELELIHQKMQQYGTENLSAYLRKMALDGYVVKLELLELKELVSLMRRSSNNLNQLTRKVHETGRVYNADLEDIHQKMQQYGTENLSAYLRKMALDGYVVKLELLELKELVSLMRRSSNNLNQLTRKVHETGRVYNADLEDISQRQEQLWEGVKEILTQLSKLS